jgi:L-2-hydroxyglutarate oxidase LhgO
VVNAAGLYAPGLAARFGGLLSRHVPTAHYAKGHYFSLAGRAPFSRLIYPVPEAAGLGVHLTLDLGGQARFGPDVQWVASPDDLSVPEQRGDAFYAEIRKYWPALPDAALQPAYAGIRPKINGPHEAARDFCIQGPRDHGVAGLVNLFGIESPGLTASLAIGEYVAGLLDK